MVHIARRRPPALGVLALMAFLGGCLGGGHPSDADLRQKFAAKQADFERVVGLLRVDATMTRVAPDFLRATGHWDAAAQGWIEDAAITPMRWEEYRALFRRLGVEQGVGANEKRTYVQFMISNEGLSIGGSSKGVAYCESPPEPLVENLDTPQRPGKAGAAYVRLTERWYLYFEWMN